MSDRNVKIKILFLINGLSLGGAEKHLFRLATSLDREKFEPIIRCLFFKGDLFDEVKAQGIDIDFIKIKRIYGISGIIGLFKLVRVIKRKKIDIVQSQLFSENILGVIAARIAGVRAIITSRRDTGMLLEGKFQHILAYKLTNRWVNKIVCVSEAVKRVVLAKEQVDPEKVEVIYNGVSLERFQMADGRLQMGDGRGTKDEGRELNATTNSQLKQNLNIKEGEFVVGMIANFSWIKGHKDFIEAAALVAKEIPNVRFLLIGDGPLLESCRLQAAGSRLEDKILFLGKRCDIPELLGIMDVSVNASYSEGMSNTVLESMAASVAVVATDVDGNREIINNNETGILIEPHNPQELAKAIVNLLKDSGLRRSLGDAARKIAEEQFTSRLMLKKFEDLYFSLVKPKIAFILSQFPETHETFILREFIALKEKGIDFCIISLKPCRDKIVHQEVKLLTEKVIYAKPFNASFPVFCIIHPIKSIATFFYVVKLYYRNPLVLLKGFYVWMECLSQANIFKKSRIAHIHSHWATLPTTAAAILSKLTGIPYSFTAHAWDIFLDNRGLSEKIENAKFVVTCTDYNRRYLQESVAVNDPLAGKIHLNYHGLEKKWFDLVLAREFMTNSTPQILAIGRLVEQKGFEYLIEACGALRDKGFEFQCNIVGDGPLREKLESIIVRLELADKVRLLGLRSQDEIKKLYSCAIVFVAPSVVASDGDRDGIPNVLLEAMASGIAVVGTNVSGIPEVILDGQTGLLVPEKDPMALADAIAKLISDDELRNTCISRSRALIEEKFDAVKNIEALLDIFRSYGVTRERNNIDSFGYYVTSKVNVLYLIWSLKTGGAERIAMHMAKMLNRSRFNPIVCCLNGKGELAVELEKEGVEVIALDKKGALDISIISRLSSIMRECSIDIVHAHLWGANFWGRIAAFFARIPIVVAHEHGIEQWRGRVHSFFDKCLYKITDRVIFVSDASKKLFLSMVKVEPSKCQVVYNGVDTVKFTPLEQENISREIFGIEKNDFVVTMVGRLVQDKGHEYFLTAISQVRMRYPHVKALIVGDGPRKEELVGLKRELGLNGSVNFLGTRDDIVSILAISDIFALPSSKEAMPLSIMEAMACKKPVVATNVGGVAELVIQNQTGLLIPSCDSAALAGEIMKLIEQPQLAQDLANAGRKRAEELFSQKKWISEIERMYEELLVSK